MCLQCGLDRAREGIAGMPVQKAAFREQLRLGQELQRPISVCVFLSLPQTRLAQSLAS